MTRYQREALANMIICAALIAANFGAAFVCIHFGKWGGFAAGAIIGLVFCWLGNQARSRFVGDESP